jgi:hypothetical protein
LEENREKVQKKRRKIRELKKTIVEMKEKLNNFLISEANLQMKIKEKDENM